MGELIHLKTKNSKINNKYEKLIHRSKYLFYKLEYMKEDIYIFYDKKSTESLISNFKEIINYSDKVLPHGAGVAFEEYFLKLENFCGQIENIVKYIEIYKKIKDN